MRLQEELTSVKYLQIQNFMHNILLMEDTSVRPIQDRDPIDPPPGCCSCRHRIAVAFTLLFKTCALLMYVVFSWAIGNFVQSFIIVTIFLSFDFWVVKNVSGRLLVGLRWFNEVLEDGTNKWVFESARNPSQFQSVDSTFFWWTLYITPLLWLILGVIAVIKFNFGWFLIVCVALSTTGANLIGFIKCDKDSKQKLARLQKMGTLLAGVDIL